MSDYTEMAEHVNPKRSLRLAAPPRAGGRDPPRRSSRRRSGCSSGRATRRRRWRRSRRRPASCSKTVYAAFETKSGVLRALWHLLLRGDEEDVPVMDRAWYREVLEEPDPERQLRLNARNARVGQDAHRGRAGRDPPRGAARPGRRGAVGAHPVRLLRQPARDRAVAATRRGRCARASMSPRATDILWTLNHPDVWQLLVGQRGWTAGAWEQWFDATLARLSCLVSASGS